MSSKKESLLRLCHAFLQQRIDSAQQAVYAAQDAANQEMKSSSGDKYETSRAMAQLDVEKNAVQLGEAIRLKHTLDQIRLADHPEVVQPGCLVVTDSELFFIAIGLGSVTLEGETYFVISAGSPLGVKFVGAKPGDTVTFKDRSYLVREIV